MNESFENAEDDAASDDADVDDSMVGRTCLMCGTILADTSIGLILAGILMIMAITIVKSASDSQTELPHHISPEENEVKYLSVSVRSRNYI